MNFIDREKNTDNGFLIRDFFYKIVSRILLNLPTKYEIDNAQITVGCKLMIKTEEFAKQIHIKMIAEIVNIISDWFLSSIFIIFASFALAFVQIKSDYR